MTLTGKKTTPKEESNLLNNMLAKNANEVEMLSFESYKTGLCIQRIKTDY